MLGRNLKLNFRNSMQTQLMSLSWHCWSMSQHSSLLLWLLALSQYFCHVFNVCLFSSLSRQSLLMSRHICSFSSLHLCCDFFTTFLPCIPLESLSRKSFPFHDKYFLPYNVTPIIICCNIRILVATKFS